MSRPIVIYGIGSLARTTLQAAEQVGLGSVAACTADRRYIAEEQFMGHPLVAFEEVEEAYPPSACDMLILVGYKRMRDRRAIFDRAKAKGYTLANLIAPNCTICDGVEMGENNIIGNYVYLGPFSRLGDHNTIRPHTHIAHDAKIGSHIFIAPGCQIASHCGIGDLSYISIGAVVIEHVTIGEESLVGAGALVLASTETGSQNLGSPARKTGEHKETGIILMR